MKLIAKWILLALAFLLLPVIIPGIAVSSFTTALVVAFFWGLVNVVIKPILLLLFLPLNLLTLGLFTFVLNALLLWGIGSFVKGFEVAGFVPAFLGALVMAVAGFLVNFILKNRDEK
ncbi:MAG: phage holin family protein [Candidatus Pacebacteria bacterium]|nr:phage holin family protein [Candidatus Paceibacterota bacterium]